MTREEALNIALSKTNNIPDAINQANMLLAYVSGKYPEVAVDEAGTCLLYTSPSPRDS